MINHTIKNQQFDKERALFRLSDSELLNCVFAGPEDGESPLKHPNNVLLKDCDFSLRYPIWHAINFEIENCRFDEKARAALWYCFDGIISDSVLGGIKALRDCQNILIKNTKIDSPEFGWKCRGISLVDSSAKAEYFFLDGHDLFLKQVNFTGKYSFQYCQDITIEDCSFETKDAFWHSENVVVRNSRLKGEYLGWFSKNLTLINCEIEGTQPLCFVENLVMENCTMVNTDLSFEDSSVQAEIVGNIESVKNPMSGSIVADSIGEIILDKPGSAKILCRQKTQM